MIIEDKRETKTVPFEDIPIGECFLTMGMQCIAMRIPALDNASSNAIYLDDGQVEYFDLDEQVIPVKAKVVVE